MNPPVPSHRLQGLLFAGVGAIAFSGKAIIVKLAYRYGVDAITVIMYRMLFAFPMFVTLSWWAGRGKPPLARNDWLMLAALGFTGYYLASYLDFTGLQYISANLERLILYLNPTVVLAVSAIFYKVHVKPMQWAALAVSYLGVLVVFGHDISLQGDHIALGSLLVLVCAISYSLYLIFSGQIVKRLGPLRITGGATSIACVLCIAQFFVLRSPAEMAVAPQVLWLSLLNAVFCTFVPVVLIMVAVDRIGAPIVSQVGIIGPLSTVGLSWLLLDEPLTVWVLIGTALVLSGVWLLTRWKYRGTDTMGHEVAERLVDVAETFQVSDGLILEPGVPRERQHKLNIRAGDIVEIRPPDGKPFRVPIGSLVLVRPNRSQTYPIQLDSSVSKDSVPAGSQVWLIRSAPGENEDES